MREGVLNPSPSLTPGNDIMHVITSDCYSGCLCTQVALTLSLLCIQVLPLRTGLEISRHQHQFLSLPLQLCLSQFGPY